MEHILEIKLIFWAALLAFIIVTGLIFALFDKVQRWLFCREKNAVVSRKAAKALKESPRSGKENIVWFPPDFGRKHPSKTHKDLVAV